MLDKNDLENKVNKKKISYNTTTGFEYMTYAIKPEHLAHWAMAAVGDIGLKVQYNLTRRINCTVLLYCKLWTQAIASKSTSKFSQFFYTTNRLPVPLTR